MSKINLLCINRISWNYLIVETIFCIAVRNVKFWSDKVCVSSVSLLFRTPIFLQNFEKLSFLYFQNINKYIEA